MPIFLNTTEIRWFYPAEIPVVIQDWFDRLGEVQYQPPRTDHYLPVSGLRLGVKMREDRLEIKFRRRQHGIFSPSKQIAGCVESWTKWGDSMSFNNSTWIPVVKERQILYYRVAEDGKVLASSPGEIPIQGGGVELARVLLGSKQLWWTIGIEVFSPDSGRYDLLKMIARLIFNPIPGELQVGHSFSYPAFISRYREISR